MSKITMVSKPRFIDVDSVVDVKDVVAAFVAAMDDAGVVLDADVAAKVAACVGKAVYYRVPNAVGWNDDDKS